MSEVRWGFVGGGNVTESKASPDGAFTQDRSRVVAVVRSDLVRSQEYARQYGIARAYGTVDELCADPEVDAVFVCTPHHLHTQHALAAIKAGKHVLCEKPLTITTREGLEVVEAAEKAGVTLGVAYYRRFYPVMEMLRAVVRSNRLGTIISAEVIRSTYSVPRRPVCPAKLRPGEASLLRRVAVSSRTGDRIGLTCCSGCWAMPARWQQASATSRPGPRARTRRTC